MCALPHQSGAAATAVSEPAVCGSEHMLLKRIGAADRVSSHIFTRNATAHTDRGFLHYPSKRYNKR